MKQITCITCPIGCRITVEVTDGGYRFSGNQCRRGAEFAEKELVSPKRSISTTVRTVFPGVPVLPVRTNGEVPKGMITDIIRELSELVVNEKIGIGEIVVTNILGTGCDIIVTSNMLKEIDND